MTSTIKLPVLVYCNENTNMIHRDIPVAPVQSRPLCYCGKVSIVQKLVGTLTMHFCHTTCYDALNSKSASHYMNRAFKARRAASRMQNIISGILCCSKSTTSSSSSSASPITHQFRAITPSLCPRNLVFQWQASNITKLHLPNP
jgi:hypothetical protein